MAFIRLPGKYGYIIVNGVNVCFTEWNFTYEGEDKPLVTFCSPRDAQNNIIRELNISVVNGTINATGYFDGGLNPHASIAPNINVGTEGVVVLGLSNVYNWFYAVPTLCSRWKTSQMAEDCAKFESSWLMTGETTFNFP
jgi:hypothetical protein